MEVIELLIDEIINIEAIKVRKLNDEMKKVVTSVANNGQQVPISIDSVKNVVDGGLRVLGLLDKGVDTVQAIVVDGDENLLAQKSFIQNIHRQKLSAVKQADIFQKSVKGKNDKESSDISALLQVKTSDDDMKDFSKAHKSKYKSISSLPEDIKKQLDYQMTPIGTSYELAKLYKDSIPAEAIKQLIRNIVDKKMSDRKAIAFLKKYKKESNNASNESEAENTEDSSGDFEEDSSGDFEEDSSVDFEKEKITINVVKHFGSHFTIEDITDEDKINIRKMIDQIFEYLKSNYNKESSEQTSQEDADKTSHQASNTLPSEDNSQIENEEKAA